MTNEEWEEASAAAEKLMEIAKNNTSLDWFKKVNDYYLYDVMVRRNESITILEADIVTIDELLAS